MIRRYTELRHLQSFDERFEYLRLNGSVAAHTFGGHRFLNQNFYQYNTRWKEARRLVIIRDNACDLGVEGYDISGQRIIIHHMNPVTIEDVENDSPILYDPEFLIVTTHNTHNAIHYGDTTLLVRAPIVRAPNDTCPWKQLGR